MNPKEYSEQFNKLYNLLTEACLNFYVWKGLQDKNFEKTFAENSYFWSAVLFSLENNWLTSLAKLYENSSFSKKAKIISVYALLPHQTDRMRAVKVQSILILNTNVIKNIKKLRDNQLAHNNAKHLLDPKVILKKFPINYGKVEQLLSATNQILSNLNPKTGHGHMYKMLVDDSENDGKQVVNKLEYHSKLNKAHLEKFRKGEVSSHRLPPP